MFSNLNINSIGVNRPYPQPNTLVKPSSVSDDAHSVCEEGVASVSRSNQGLTVTTTLPWHRRALASCTMYGELSTAYAQEEFAPVRIRFQQEWIFDAGFVSRFIIVLFCRFPANPLFDVKLVALSSYVFSVFFFTEARVEDGV